MTISSAFTTAVSGLQANSKGVGAISENIANANTVGYRRGFAAMVTTTASSLGTTGVLSVRAVDRVEMNSPGGLISTDAPLDMAISGNGFFTVSVNADETRLSNYLLTRAGSFLPDENGNLVNTAGYYLAGYEYNPDGTLPEVDRFSFSELKTVNISNISLSASATSEIAIFGNVPAQETGVAVPGDPFLSSTEYFTPLGASERLQFSWQPTATNNAWDLTILDGGGAALGNVTVTFNDSGAAAGAPTSYTNATSTAVAPAAFAFDTASGVASLTLDNDGSTQTIEVNFGAPNTLEGISQFTGDYAQTFDNDGTSTGQLSRTEIDDGILYGVFTNGSRRPLFEIPLTVVENPNGLIEQRGNAYTMSNSAGEFQALTANTSSAGSIIGKALEGSNVDIAEELTELIKLQRAYSTNATVVTTVDEIMEETTRLKR